MRYLSFALLLLSFALCTQKVLAQSATAQSGGSPGDAISGTITLKQAVDIAMKNNLVINQSDLTSQSYKIAFDQSWEYMLPTFSASAGQSINFGRSIISSSNTYVNSQFESGSAGVNAGLVIFKGLQYQNGLKQARYAYDASKRDLQWQRDNITLNVLLQYLLILSNRDQLALARTQAQVDSVQLERLKLQNAEGALSPMSNLTDLQGQYAGDMVNIANAVNNLESSKVGLFTLLNIPYNRDVDYQNTVTTSDIAEYPANSDSIFRTALQVLPNVESARLKVLVNEKALAVARGAYFPTVSFGAGVSTNWTNSPAPSSSHAADSTYSPTQGLYNANGTQYNIYSKQYLGVTSTYPKWGDQFKNNRGENIGINISVPILNGFQVRNNVRNAKLNLRNAQLNNTNIRLVLQQNVELAFQNMIQAYKSLKFYTEQAKAYEESFRIANIRFTEGVIASDAYILAKGHSDQAEVNLAASKYIYIFRTKVLDYYQNKLAIPTP